MKRKTIKHIILTLTLMAWATAEAPAAEVDVKLFKISEQRTRQLIESAGPSAGNAGLTVTLILQGGLVGTATHFGGIRVSQARDDLGSSLIHTARCCSATTTRK